MCRDNGEQASWRALTGACGRKPGGGVRASSNMQLSWQTEGEMGNVLQLKFKHVTKLGRCVWWQARRARCVYSSAWTILQALLHKYFMDCCNINMLSFLRSYLMYIGRKHDSFHVNREDHFLNWKLSTEGFLFNGWLEFPHQIASDFSQWEGRAASAKQNNASW